METEKLKRLINDVGMATFIKYYYIFKEIDRDKAMRSIVENYTEKSKGTRTSKAHKIFNDRLNVDVLKYICDSKRVDDATRRRAKEILSSEIQ